MAQIRGAFPFPPTSPQNMGAPGVVCLASGRTYNIPAGEYSIVPGPQTVLQWWDPLNQLWRSTQAEQGVQTYISSDGTNYRLLNASGIVQGASITNAGSGGTNGIGPVQTGSTVSFGAPASGLASDTAAGYVVVGGTVPAPTVTQAGSGFLIPPLIVCDPPPPGGVQATFVCTLTSGGGINTVTQVNAGAGYTSIPQFYIIPQFQNYNGAPRYPGDTAIPVQPGTNWAPGLIHPNNLWNGSPYQGNLSSASGALLTGNALTGSGTLTAIIVTYQGGTYAGGSIPTITLAGTSLGAAAATAIMAFCSTVAPGSSLTGQSGATYVVGNPTFTSLGLIASNSNNGTFTPRPIRGIVTNATGPVITVEDPGFGIQSAGTGVKIGPSGGTLGNVNATNLGGVNDYSILQGQVQ